MPTAELTLHQGTHSGDCKCSAPTTLMTGPYTSKAFSCSKETPLSSRRNEFVPGCPMICQAHTHTISRARGFARMQRALHSKTSLRRFLQDLAVKGSHIKLQRKRGPNKHLSSADQLIPFLLPANTSTTHTQGVDVSPHAHYHSVRFLCNPICSSCKL